MLHGCMTYITNKWYDCHYSQIKATPWPSIFLWLAVMATGNPQSTSVTTSELHHVIWFYICCSIFLRSPFSILHLVFFKQNPLGCEMMWSLWQGFDWVEVETGGEPGRITERKAVTSRFSFTLGKFLLSTGRFFIEVILIFPEKLLQNTLEAMNGMCCQMSLESLASLVVGWSWLKPGYCYLALFVKTGGGEELYRIALQNVTWHWLDRFSF